MADRLEGRTLGRWLAALLAALLFFGRPAGASGAEIQWQPGFPMRAGGQVLLMWVPYPGAEAYRVVRRDLSTQEESRWEVRGAQYVDADASADRSFLYSVQAVLGGGAPGPISEVKKVEGFKPLAAPKWVGGYQDAKGVSLAWEAVRGAAFYNLYRSAPGGAPALVASVQDTKYVDTKARSGEFLYRVRAVGLQSQESQDSETLRVSATMPAAAAAGPQVQKRYVEVVGVLRESNQYRLKEPTDLVLSKGQLFVSDLGSRSVLALEKDGALAYRFGSPPPEYVGTWGIPWGLALSADGETVAVTFLRSPNLRVFSRLGALLLDVIVPRPKEYEDALDLPQPMDVVFDADGDLWVSEYTYGQVVVLGAKGREVARVGKPRRDKDSGPFRSPTFLAFLASSEEVFTVDSLLGEVFALNPSAQVARRWKRPKADEGVLNLPKGIAPLGDGSLLVVDGIRSSLQAFGPAGELRAVYFSKGKEFLDLRGLVTAAADPKTGEVYALSKVDSTIYRLKPVAP